MEHAVPLLHSDLALAPMMEAALALIDEHCAASSSELVGYYHANAVHDNNAVSAVAKRIADKIHETVKERSKHDACLMVIDNLVLEGVAVKLRQGSEDAGRECGVKLAIKAPGSGAWVPDDDAEVDGVAQGSAQARLVELVAKGAQAWVVDFDNHVDDHALCLPAPPRTIWTRLSPPPRGNQTRARLPRRTRGATRAPTRVVLTHWGGSGRGWMQQAV